MKRDRLFSKIILSLVLIFLFNCLVFKDGIYAEDSSQQVICSIKVKGYYWGNGAKMKNQQPRKFDMESQNEFMDKSKPPNMQTKNKKL